MKKICDGTYVDPYDVSSAVVEWVSGGGYGGYGGYGMVLTMKNGKQVVHDKRFSNGEKSSADFALETLVKELHDYKVKDRIGV